MKNLYLTVLAVVVLLGALSTAFAGVLHEDVCYWYKDGNDVMTIFNPSTDWLNGMLPSDQLLVKVQQTVYDESFTKALLARNGDGDRTGFLYAYSVTNLNVGDPADLSDMGITNFGVGWQVAPTYVTVSKQTLPDWVVDPSTSQPAWKWTSSADPGILPGQTVGGYWAVSNVSVDGEVSANAVHVGPFGPDTLNGKTTGPVIPDAPTFLSLATGLLSLGLTRKLRRK